MNAIVLDYFSKKQILSTAFWDAFKEHKVFLYLALCFFVFTYPFLWISIGYSGEQYFTEVFGFAFRSVILGGSGAAAFFLVVRLIQERPKNSPLKFCYQVLRDEILSPDNRWRVIFGILGISLTMSTFLILKDSIPRIQPFSYDVSFEYLDRIIHFGYQPWELLQPLLGHEYITLVIHRLYYFWFPVIFVTFYWQIGSYDNNKLRLQFITSFIACWILIGGVMATMLSSAGPIFFDRVVLDQPNPYLSSMDYLLELHREHEMVMFFIRDALWANYVSPEADTALKGISAMPSMHVAISFLLMLFGWRKGLYFGLAYTAFFIAILLGSVHLLWHYAIDGYVSIIATWIIWIVCGKLANSQALSPSK